MNREANFYGNCKSIKFYDKIDKIATGTYGTIYRASEKSSNRVVALKRILLHNFASDGFPLTALREIQNLRDCKDHDNIVQLLEVAAGSDLRDVYLVYEYCEHDLGNLLNKIKSPFQERDIKSLMIQLLSAVQHLHHHHIIHRDIKLINLLYNSRGRLKLADFGLSRKLAESSSNSAKVGKLTLEVVSLWYRAPELLLGFNTYSYPIDVWACGVIFCELVLSSSFLKGSTELDQLFKIFEVLGCPNQLSWPELSTCPLIESKAIDFEEIHFKFPLNRLHHYFPNVDSDTLNLMNSFLHYNPDGRITVSAALRHNYFKISPLPTDPDFMPTFPSSHHPIENVTNTKRKSSNQFSLNKRKK
jgi:serine/threonine protein kinase